MSLLAELQEFVRDHRPHGGMMGDATPPAWNGYQLTDMLLRRGVRAVGHTRGR